MRKIVRSVICFALALSLACCAGLTCLAEEQEDVPSVSLPEPQDLADLFPYDDIVTQDFGDFTISCPSSMQLELGDAEGGLFQRLLTLTDSAGNKLTITRLDQQLPVDDSYLAHKVDQLTAELDRQIGLITGILPGKEKEYSLNSSVVDFFGHPAACIVASYDMTIFGRRIKDESYHLSVPLTEKGAYEFVIKTDKESSLSECVALFSVLYTVEWKDIAVARRTEPGRRAVST